MKIMEKFRVTTIWSVLVGLLLVVANCWLAEAKIVPICNAVNELKIARISRSMMSNWICLMKSVSEMDTRLIRGPGYKSSYTFGILQICSLTWCSRGHKGGACNKRCEDFADDDIQDDIACAKKIVDTKGFKDWEGWLKNCKGKPLPDISYCKARRSLSLESFFEDVRTIFSPSPELHHQLD